MDTSGPEMLIPIPKNMAISIKMRKTKRQMKPKVLAFEYPLPDF